MDFFYIVVPSIAVIILLLVLVYIGIMMAGAKNKAVYPPSYNTCPDYWTSDGSGNCTPGNSNTGNGAVKSAMGYNSQTKSFNVNDPRWNGYKGTATQQCAWQSWATNNGVEWDGVTNYNGC